MVFAIASAIYLFSGIVLLLTKARGRPAASRKGLGEILPGIWGVVGLMMLLMHR